MNKSIYILIFVVLLIAAIVAVFAFIANNYQFGLTVQPVQPTTSATVTVTPTSKPLIQFGY